MSYNKLHGTIPNISSVIVYLGLGHNEFEQSFFKDLKQMLINSQPYLYYLDLSHNKFHGSIFNLQDFIDV